MTLYDDKTPSTVYLRPSPKTREIRYIDSIEKSAMIVDQKHSIAMYVSKNGSAQGPQDSLLDTIIASASDEYTPISLGGPKTTFRAPYPLDLTTGYVRMSLTTAPTGANFAVSILVNGSQLTIVQIDDGMKTSVGSSYTPTYSFTDIPDDAEFTVIVISVGSTFAGAGLKVAVTGKKVYS